MQDPAASASAGQHTGQHTGQRGSQQQALLLLASLSFFWGVNWPAIKLSVDEVPAWTYRLICLVIGIVGLFAVARGARLSLRVPRRDLRPLFIASLGNITFWHICSAVGVSLMQPGRASILAFTMPLWAAVIAAIWIGERLTGLRLLGLGTGLAGLAVLVVPDWQNLTAAPGGPVLMLLAALSWAFGTVALKSHTFSMPTTSLVAWQMLLGGLPILVGALVFDRGFDPTAVSAVGWWAVAYSAIIPTVYCQWAWFRVVGVYPAVVAAVGTLAIPVIGLLSSALIMGEAIGWNEIVALALIVTALFLVLVVPMLRRRGEEIA